MLNDSIKASPSTKAAIPLVKWRTSRECGNWERSMVDAATTCISSSKESKVLGAGQTDEKDPVNSLLVPLARNPLVGGAP